MLGVKSIHPANSGPDMLLLLLKAPTKNWAPIISNKAHKLSIKFFNRFLLDYFMSINWPEPSSIQKIASCSQSYTLQVLLKTPSKAILLIEPNVTLISI